MLFVASSCRHAAPVESHGEMEIARDPAILYAKSDRWMNMRLYEVALGDDASELLRQRIVGHNDAGWVRLRNGARYLIANGRVQGLGVWDQRLLSQLAINSPADVESKFGKPQRVDDLGKETIYRYQDDHLRVMWNEFERRVTTVNVVR
jgi:hypothetical protein